MQGQESSHSALSQVLMHSVPPKDGPTLSYLFFVQHPEYLCRLTKLALFVQSQRFPHAAIYPHCPQFYPQKCVVMGRSCQTFGLS